MTPELCQTVADKIAAGEYLADFCGKDGIPSRWTVWRHMDADPAFATQCARARERSAEMNERRIAGVIDDTLSGAVPPDVARVAINGLTWLAKVRAPKVYGDQVDVKHGGSVTLKLSGDDERIL